MDFFFTRICFLSPIKRNTVFNFMPVYTHPLAKSSKHVPFSPDSVMNLKIVFDNLVISPEYFRKMGQEAQEKRNLLTSASTANVLPQLWVK